jgi:hypothetical protein
MTSRIVPISLVFCCTMGFALADVAAQSRSQADVAAQSRSQSGKAVGSITDPFLSRNLDTAFLNLFCERAQVLGLQAPPVLSLQGKRPGNTPSIAEFCSGPVEILSHCVRSQGTKWCTGKTLDECRELASTCTGPGESTDLGDGDICIATGCPIAISKGHVHARGVNLALLRQRTGAA